MTAFSQLKSALIAWPELALEGGFEERPHERLRNALRDFSSCGKSDIVSLVRHVLRFEQERHGGNVVLKVPADSAWPNKEEWERAGVRVKAVENGLELTSRPWDVAWLHPLHSNRTKHEPEREGVFSAAEAETSRHPRHLNLGRRIPTEPSIRKATKFEHYLSVAQAETVRSVVLSPPGAIRTVVLPTGCGKSLVGLALATVGAKTGLTVIVVPTIALAHDQMDQASAQLGPEGVAAWHSGLDEGARKSLKEQIRSGTQRLLYTSPESLVGTLRKPIQDVARMGLLRGFVIDEAHLVSQWGASFRPEFQTLAALWLELRQTCPPDRIFRTVLMTATLTSDSFADLKLFFDPDGEMETLASVYLRSECDYYLSRCTTEEEKEARILEILRHAPRPAILYVTEVKDAEKWHQRCLDHGWLRTGILHGKSTPNDRSKTIDLWRENQLDLMVATSAFGLGMDKGDVRLVLHACVPETVDRYYQEVGRGGRDGNACVSIVVWTSQDFVRAASMSKPQIIQDELGLARWKSMLRNERTVGDVTFVDLNAKRLGIDWSGERNAKWNLRTLLLLARAGVIEIVPEELPEKSEESEEDVNEKRIAIRYLRAVPQQETDWNDAVGEYRNRSTQRNAQNWQNLVDLLNREREFSAIICDVYKVPEAGIHFVSPTADDFAPSPCTNHSTELRPELKEFLNRRPWSYHFLTYKSVDVSLIEGLKKMARQGIREFALPEHWRKKSEWSYYENPLHEMERAAPERFLVIRDLQEDESFAGMMSLPRVTFFPPDFEPATIPDDILSIERSAHLILIPENLQDPAHPLRKIETRREAIRLDDFLNQIK